MSTKFRTGAGTPDNPFVSVIFYGETYPGQTVELAQVALHVDLVDALTARLLDDAHITRGLSIAPGEPR
jgi:hypothetical protein